MFIKDFAQWVFQHGTAHQHKKAGRGFGQKIPRGQSARSRCGTGGGPHGQWQIINLVNGVVTRSLAATDATNDRVDACGTKLHERVQLNTSGESVYGFPSGSLVSQPKRSGFGKPRKFLPRKGPPAGGWSAPEELDMQALDNECSIGFQLFASLLRRRGGWFANRALVGNPRVSSTQPGHRAPVAIHASRPPSAVALLRRMGGPGRCVVSTCYG
jgi:hypothetical protein